MLPRGAFVKMYYFAIEARDGVGYTLAALRCGKLRSLKISNWQLAKATAFTTKDTKEHKGAPKPYANQCLIAETHANLG
jgi:hypothetical protein